TALVLCRAEDGIRVGTVTGVQTCALSICAMFVFFFQAEDGIRDFHVTGVQTCALPISRPFAIERAGWNSRVEITDHSCCAGLMRSEERRVGKECRCRGSPLP